MVNEVVILQSTTVFLGKEGFAEVTLLQVLSVTSCPQSTEAQTIVTWGGTFQPSAFSLEFMVHADGVF
jgi:hypothetical protein